MNKTFIYILKDPLTEAVRYVGKSNDPRQRYNRHIRNALAGKTYHIANWLRSLLNKELKPVLAIVEECDVTIWKERETHWIAYYKAAGFDLTNCKDGGDGLGFICEETRQRMAAAKIGKPSPKKGIPLSEEARQKLSEAAKKKFSRMSAEERHLYLFPKKRTYKPLSETHKEKLRAKANERLQNPIYLQQLKEANRLGATAMKGRQRTEEEKQTARERNLRRWANMSEEERRAAGLKIREALQNKKMQGAAYIQQNSAR